MSTAQQSLTAVRKGNSTVFECHSDTAKAVFLAGSFNNWSATATPMTRDNSGHWTVSLPLAPGGYEYKFVVDGEWCCEPGCTYKEVHCPHCTMNEFGTMNRVVEVQ
jgi:1,4-alpha-glucan branching enzyme